MAHEVVVCMEHDFLQARDSGKDSDEIRAIELFGWKSAEIKALMVGTL
jgi:hypothetical protein